MLCRHCGTDVPEASNCKICDFPLMKSEKEQAAFIARQIREESNIRDSIQKMKYPRYILFILSGLNFILPFTPLYPSGDLVTIVTGLVFGAFFLGFGILSFRYPQVALLIPLIVMVLLYTIEVIIEPTSIFNGFVWRVVIIGGLSFGFYRAYDANRTLKRNPYLAKKLGYERLGQKVVDTDLLDRDPLK